MRRQKAVRDLLKSWSCATAVDHVGLDEQRDLVIDVVTRTRGRRFEHADVRAPMPSELAHQFTSAQREPLDGRESVDSGAAHASAARVASRAADRDGAVMTASGDRRECVARFRVLRDRIANNCLLGRTQEVRKFRDDPVGVLVHLDRLLCHRCSSRWVIVVAA